MPDSGDRFPVPIDSSECIERAVGEGDLDPRGALKWQAIRLRKVDRGVSVFRAMEHPDVLKRNARDVKMERYLGLAEASVGALRGKGNDVVDRRREEIYEAPRSEPPRAHAEIEFAAPPVRISIQARPNEPEELTKARADEVSFYRDLIRLFEYKGDPAPLSDTWSGPDLNTC